MCERCTAAGLDERQAEIAHGAAARYAMPGYDALGVVLAFLAPGQAPQTSGWEKMPEPPRQPIYQGPPRNRRERRAAKKQRRKP